MFRVSVKCPHLDCGKSLMDNDVKVSNRPSIKLLARKDGKEGFIYISSIYGDYNIIEPNEFDISPGDIVEFFCPHCKKPLPVLEKCSCGAPVLELMLESGGRLKFCSRKGCHYHSLSFEDPADLDRFLGAV